jgi:hypothetical protein
MLFSLVLVLAAETSTLVPFNDLGPAPYAYGYYGGLYEDGSNTIPADHLAGGLRRAALIRPLDANGQPSPSGKIVFLGVGPGETARITDAFIPMAASDRRVDHQSLVVLDAALDGFDATAWFLPAAIPNFNRIKEQILAPNGVTEKQVQAAWVQMITYDAAPPLPRQDADAYRVKGYIATALRNLKVHYPNLQVAYLSSRVYGGYATASSKPEPYAYESALSVRWVILGQVTLMRTGFLWDTRISDVDYEKGVAPWVAWGPYFWANGTMPRSDGLTWERDDFAADGETLSEKGARKSATMLLDFLLQEPTAVNWFRAPAAPPRSRAVRP